MLDARFFMFAGNSFVLAAISAAVSVAVALVLAYAQRRRPDPLVSGAVRLGSMGYAIPGAVIAVGVLLAFGAFDNAIDAWSRASFGVGTGLVVTGSIAGLVFAYVVRFLAIPVNAAEAGFARVTQSMDGAARTSGRAPGRGPEARPRPASGGQRPHGRAPGVRRRHEGAAGHADPQALQL